MNIYLLIRNYFFFFQKNIHLYVSLKEINSYASSWNKISEIPKLEKSFLLIKDHFLHSFFAFFSRNIAR